MKLWGGRFTKSTDSATDHFHSSISFDQRMYKEDITGSIAHAKMLGKQGIIPVEDSIAIQKALKEILTLIEGNLAFHPFLNSVIGMTYDFLPFMILPIYNTIVKLDNSLIEAAKDLGADDTRAFLKITLPLSVPGIVSGISMVFLPAMTNYVVLDMLYNSTYIMGSLIGSFFSAYNWHGGSMIALVLLGIICLTTLLMGSTAEEDARTGGALL